MTHRSDEMTPDDAPKRSRWLLPVAGAAAAVLVVGAIAAVVASDSGNEAAALPTTTITPTTTQAPTTTAAPVETESTTTTVPPATAPPQVRQATVTIDGTGCRYEGPNQANVGDTVELTLVNSTDQHVFLDIYRFRPAFSTENLPALAATPERALDAIYDFGSMEVWMDTPPNSEDTKLYFDPNSRNYTGDPFVLRYERGYGFICWSAPGTNPNTINAGAAAADGFIVLDG